MTYRAEASRLASRQSRPWYSVLGYFLTFVLGLSGCLFALYQLITPPSSLRIEQTRLGPVPVTIFGSGDPSGPAIVIAHGFAASQQIMYPFATTLARNGYTAITFDLPGHGQHATPFRGELADRELRYSQLEAALDQVVAYAHQHSDGQVGLVGHSMGSEAVARYAQEHETISAVVGVSLVYDQVTADSPRNLLVITGGLEAGLRTIAEQIANDAAGGAGVAEVTYGDFTDGTARRIVFAPWVEHIGVLFSPVSLREALNWFDAVFERPTAPQPYLDQRVLWIGLLYVSATLLFAPLTLALQPIKQPQRRSVRAWWALAIIPAIVTPVIVRFLPTTDLLPILVGGPLAAHFAIYGALTGLGLILLRRRTPAEPASQGHPAGPLTIFRQRFLIYTAMALLVVGYVFLTFGLPTHLFILNYFPPIERLPVLAAVFVAMLLYFIADETLTRGVDAPRGAYAITKIALMASLALAIALDQQLFFLILIVPLFAAYFIIYGLFSYLIHRRTGTLLVGALANAVIFAWIIAVTFPLTV